jgi:secreted PhoX family phosphatase
MKRRSFIEFVSWGSVLAGSGIVSSCANLKAIKMKSQQFMPPNDIDDLHLASGLKFDFLLTEGQKINLRGDKFGANNDFIALIPITSTESYLWVNHESLHPLFVSGWDGKSPRLIEQVNLERKVVGGSLLRIKKNKEDASWELDLKSNDNRRYDATTKIPFAGNITIAGSKFGEGTLANCAGGVTPWGTFLTCEENYHQFYGDSDRAGNIVKSFLSWETFYKNSPLHYGWVVEIDPRTKKAQKHTALGRFSHESATCVSLPDGRVVVYSGDDHEDQFLYKFISSNKNSLDEGELFVADFEKNIWLSLSIEKSSMLKEKFSNQLEVLCYCREAGALLGATPLARPEDVEIHPMTGEIFVALTNSASRNNFHGAIRKIKEIDHESGTFLWEEFVVGGTLSGLSCPDNLVFDHKGNLWVTNDIAGKLMNQGIYTSFKNNGLYYIPTSGEDAGRVFQVASAPRDAEFTGPCFAPDQRQLFLSIQHPGESTRDLKNPKNYSSHWPHLSEKNPLSCVVSISGPLMDQLLN